MNLPPIAPAPKPAAGLRVLHTLWRAWDRLAIYLPLLLMGLLALLTYWMVRNTPEMSEPQARRPQPNEVDFFMRGAVVKAFDAQGRLQNQLSGTEMRHYADKATVEVDQARWQGVGPDGRLTRASAQRALSTDDGSQVQLLGQAVVVREAAAAAGKPLPRQEFRGESLQIFTDDDRVLSNQPVRFFSGDDEFSAQSFRYDHLRRVIELQGRVKATLVSTPARSTAPRERAPAQRR